MGLPGWGHRDSEQAGRIWKPPLQQCCLMVGIEAASAGAFLLGEKWESRVPWGQQSLSSVSAAKLSLPFSETRTQGFGKRDWDPPGPSSFPWWLSMAWWNAGVMVLGWWLCAVWSQGCAALGTMQGTNALEGLLVPLLSRSTGSSLGSGYPACLPICWDRAGGFLWGQPRRSRAGGLQNDLKQSHPITLCTCTGGRTFWLSLHLLAMTLKT